MQVIRFSHDEVLRLAKEMCRRAMDVAFVEVQKYRLTLYIWGDSVGPAIVIIQGRIAICQQIKNPKSKPNESLVRLNLLVWVLAAARRDIPE